MPDTNSSVINIALVGGKTYCREVLEKTNLGFIDSEVSSRIIAVADPDPDTPGMILARKLELKTVSNYYDLYLPENHVDLIIILEPEKAILKDILATKPDNIRAMSYNTFEIFWKAIGVQEQKLTNNTKILDIDIFDNGNANIKITVDENWNGLEASFDLHQSLKPRSPGKDDDQPEFEHVLID